MNYEKYIFVEYMIPIVGIIITAIAQFFVNSSYNKFKMVYNKNKITGFEAARKMLDSNGLKDVKINKVSGTLTDHYDPRSKEINLSREIYDGTSIASVSVAAHECGHAIQDKDNYVFLKIRAALIPFVNFSSKFGYIIVFIGLIFDIIGLSKLGILILLVILLFQLVTLPVEFNASSRALKQLVTLDILADSEEHNSKTMLKAAAFTYVASLMSTLLQLFRLVLIVFGRNNDD